MGLQVPVGARPHLQCGLDVMNIDFPRSGRLGGSGGLRCELTEEADVVDIGLPGRDPREGATRGALSFKPGAAAAAYEDVCVLGDTQLRIVLPHYAFHDLPWVVRHACRWGCDKWSAAAGPPSPIDQLLGQGGRRDALGDPCALARVHGGSPGAHLLHPASMAGAVWRRAFAARAPAALVGVHPCSVGARFVGTRATSVFAPRLVEHPTRTNADGSPRTYLKFKANHKR